MSSRRAFCSDVSLENGEPLAATASRIDHWLLVEYRGLWGPDALRASGLSDQVKQSLREQVHARPHSRLLFVRRPDRRGRAELRAYAATSREGEESLRCASFSSYDELRTLDLATTGELLERPLFLVCTHGKHDPLLRAARPSALRSARRAGRGRGRVADDAHRRRPLRRQPPLPFARRVLRARRARDAGRCSMRTSTRRSTSRTTAAGRATRSPRRLRSATSASAQGSCGLDDLATRVGAGSASATFRRPATGPRARVERSGRSSRARGYLTCTATEGCTGRGATYVSRLIKSNPFAHEPRDEREPTRRRPGCPGRSDGRERLVVTSANSQHVSDEPGELSVRPSNVSTSPVPLRSSRSASAVFRALELASRGSRSPSARTCPSWPSSTGRRERTKFARLRRLNGSGAEPARRGSREQIVCCSPSGIERRKPRSSAHASSAALSASIHE